MRTIDKIITKVDCKYGAKMARHDVLPKNLNITTVNNKKFLNGKKIFDCKVPMSADNAYDTGNVYWGCGPELRVAYTKDLSYIQFYRLK